MKRDQLLSMERFAERMWKAVGHAYTETNILWEHVAAIWQHLAETQAKVDEHNQALVLNADTVSILINRIAILQAKVAALESAAQVGYAGEPVIIITAENPFK